MKTEEEALIEEAVLALWRACKQHWSEENIASVLGLTLTDVIRIERKFGLK